MPANTGSEYNPLDLHFIGNALIEMILSLIRSKYPKTDYTYSKLSQQRREIKPGVLAMPNMSRRSLEHHHERVNQMIQNNPSQESFLRTRYESFLALRKRRSAADYSYDSQDEIDLSQFGKNSSYTTFTSSTSATWLRRLFTAIITFFSSIYTSATSIFRRKQSGSVYYSRYATQEKRGKCSRVPGSSQGSINKHFLSTHSYRNLWTHWPIHFQRRIDCFPSHLLGNIVGIVPRLVALALIKCVRWQKEGNSHRPSGPIAVASYRW